MAMGKVWFIVERASVSPLVPGAIGLLITALFTEVLDDLPLINKLKLSS